MSTCYWMITGIGICTKKIAEHIDKKKLAHVLSEHIPDNEELLSMIKSDNYDGLNVDDYLHKKPFENLADLLCHCDDTDTITCEEDGQGNNYFYYSPSMPWHRRENEPQSREEVYARILAAVQKITTLSEEDVDNFIDDLSEPGWG